MNCVCKLHVRAAKKGYRILTTSNGAIMKRVNTTFNKALSQYPQRMNQKRSPPVLQRRNPFSLETTKSQPTEKYRCENFAHAKILWKTNKQTFVQNGVLSSVQGSCRSIQEGDNDTSQISRRLHRLLCCYRYFAGSVLLPFRNVSVQRVPCWIHRESRLLCSFWYDSQFCPSNT